MSNNQNTPRKEPEFITRTRHWFRNHSKECYIGLGVLLAIIAIIVLVRILTKPADTLPVTAIPKLETAPSKPSVIVDNKKREVTYTQPEGRDNYVHIESVPEDGLYEQIEACTPILSDKISQDILKKLSAYIQQQQDYKDMKFIFSDQTDTAYTCWISGDNLYWRLKYYFNDKKITADGAMRDFWYETFSDWDYIYQDVPEELKGISIDAASSMTAKIMEQYPYDEYRGSNGPWFWDKDDENNFNLYTDSYTLRNKKYTDTWIMEYQAGKYICMYRKIADPVY